MDTRKRAVLYARISQDRRKNRPGRSVDDQLSGSRAWAARSDVDVVSEHRDDGISASAFAAGKVRPGWTLVLELILSGAVDFLVVWEFSRASRDRAVSAALFAALVETGTLLVIDGKVHDPTDPDDAFMLDLGAALSVRESAVISKRSKIESRSRAAAGKPHGPVTFGTAVEYDPATGRPIRRVLDERAAAVVREAARRILVGETPTAVANDLNRRKIRTPQPARGKAGKVNLRKRRWIGNNLLRTIAAPAMAGLVVHNGQVLPGVVGEWPAVLTVAEHEQLQMILRDESRKTVRNGSHVRALLTGVGRCDVCGGPLGTITRKRSAGPQVVYRCRERFCVQRVAAELDEVIEAVITRWLATPGRSEALAAASGDPDVAAAADEAARGRLQLDEARALVAAGDLSLASLVDLEKRIQPRIEAAERRARPRHVPGVVLDAAGPEAVARWHMTPVAARRQIVAALVEIRIGKAPARGRFSATGAHTDSIRITWKAA